jgi:PAS domain S-box-containing protein
LISARIRRKYSPVAGGVVCTAPEWRAADGRIFDRLPHPRKSPALEKLRFLELLGNEAALAIERIRLAEGLREREAQLRCLFESQVIGIFFVNLHSGNIIDVNDAFLQLIGFRREDVLAGKLQWEAITPPEYLPLDKQGIEALRRTQVCALSRRNTHVKMAAVSQ